MDLVGSGLASFIDKYILANCLPNIHCCEPEYVMIMPAFWDAYVCEKGLITFKGSEYKKIK